MKEKDRAHAIELRRAGQSYREILQKIPVAKSTLSLWLRSVGLSIVQKQRLTEKRIAASRRGAERKRNQRITSTTKIKELARGEIGDLSPREYWLLGIALYWAEGSKEKAYKPGIGLIFNNSDPAMVRFYVEWLKKCCKVSPRDIQLTLYIHDTKRSEISAVIKFWETYLKFPSNSIAGVYFKRSPVKTVRKNTSNLYYGTMRVRVLRSSALGRKVAGWIEGLAQ